MRVALLMTIVLLAASTLAAAPSKELELAKLMSREGRLDEAVKAAEAAHLAAPADAETARLYQDLLREKSGESIEWSPGSAVPEILARYLNARALEPKKAELALKALAGEDGAPPQVKLDLALAALALGKIRTAENCVKEYLAKNPDDAEGHFVQGRVRHEDGKDHAAKAALRRAVTIEPHYAEATVLLASILRAGEEGTDARKLLKEALEVYPKNPVLVAGLGEDHFTEEEWQPATASFAKAVELRPGRMSYRVRQAESQLKLRKYDDVIATVTGALEIDAGHAVANATIGLAYEKKKDYEKALEHYRAAVKAEPKWIRAHVDVGFVHTLMGDYKKAEEALKKALKLDKKDPQANLSLGMVYYQLERAKDAKKHFSVVLKQNSDHLLANRLMGYVVLSEGKAKDAIKYFEKVSKLDPEDPDSLRMIGRAKLSLGKVQEALDSIYDALDRDPRFAPAQFDLGKTLEADQNFDGAREAYEKAIELDASYPDPHLYLAELLDEVDNEPEKALGHYRTYLELGGDDPYGDVKERIKQLEK
jgi:tetratricopeptide (TPR) repeat protein